MARDMSVTYFCLVESENNSTAHMKVLDAECPLAAQEETACLTSQHLSTISAYVFIADAPFATL